MAKLITKENLAAFRSFPDIWKSDIDRLFDVCNRYDSPVSLPEDSTREEREKAYKYIRELYKYFSELSEKDADSEWFYDSLVSMKSAIVSTDLSDDSYDTWLLLSEGIQEAEWLLYVTETIYINQGAVTEDENGNESLPKLLLISAERFEEGMQSTRKDMDLTYLYQNFGNGMRYEIFMHDGPEQAEWGFSVKKMPLPSCNYAFKVSVVNYSDHRISSYYVRESEGMLSVYTEQECIVNGETCEYLHPDAENLCSAPYFGCQRRYMETVLTILSALSEYVRLKDIMHYQPAKKEEPKGPSEPVPSYEFDGITVYDYYAGAMPDVHEGRFTGTGIHGSEKRPHIRQGTMRYNPKTGEKDIYVKSSVVHRDRYKGYETADRIN